MRYLCTFFIAFFCYSNGFVFAQRPSLNRPANESRSHSVRPASNRTSNQTVAQAAFTNTSMSAQWRSWETILNSSDSNSFYGEMSAKDLVHKLNDAGLPVTLHESATDDGLTEDEPITLELPDRRLGTRLKVALEKKNACLTFMRDHISIISLDETEDFDQFMQITYNVSGLGVDIETLAQTIQGTVDVDSWQDTGQGVATLEYISVRGQDLFAIAQSYENHQAIQELLGGINRLTGNKSVRNLHSRQALNTPQTASRGGSQPGGRMFGRGR